MNLKMRNRSVADRGVVPAVSGQRSTQTVLDCVLSKLNTYHLVTHLCTGIDSLKLEPVQHSPIQLYV